MHQGDDVGIDCTDKVLESVYAQGVLDTTNGSDIVLWLAIRHHHEPRFNGEEAEYMPYHYEEFHLTPRGFEVLRVRDLGDEQHTNAEAVVSTSRESPPTIRTTVLMQSS